MRVRTPHTGPLPGRVAASASGPDQRPAGWFGNRAALGPGRLESESDGRPDLDEGVVGLAERGAPRQLGDDRDEAPRPRRCKRS